MIEPHPPAKPQPLLSTLSLPRQYLNGEQHAVSTTTDPRMERQVR